MHLLLAGACESRVQSSGREQAPQAFVDEDLPAVPPKSVSLAEIRDEVLRTEELSEYEPFRTKVYEIALSKKLRSPALELGLDRSDFDLVKNMSRFRQDRLGDRYLNKFVLPKVIVTEKELSEALAGKEFDDRVSLRVLLPRDADAAAGVRKGIDEGKDFDTLMDLYGTETGKKSGGRVGMISRSIQFIPDESKTLVFEKAKVGQIIGPVSTYVGEVFLLIDERMTAAQMRESARIRAANDLLPKKLKKVTEEEYERLKKKYGVTVYGEDEQVFEPLGGKKVRVYARVGNTVVTSDSFEGSGSKFHDPGNVMDRERQLRLLLTRIVFAKAAEEEGLAEDADYRKEYDEKLERELFGAYKSYVYTKPVPAPSNGELKAFYDKQKERDLSKFPEATYFLLWPVDDTRLKEVESRARGISNKAQLEAASKELGLRNELLLKKRMSEIPEDTRKVLSAHVDNDVFPIRRPDGNWGVYKLLFRDKEERRPTFEQSRKEIEKMWVLTYRNERLQKFLEREGASLGYDEANIRKLYDTYVSQRKGKSSRDPATPSQSPGDPHSGMRR